MATRLRACDSAALATSVHFICRPRPEDATDGDWGQVLRELPKRVADWMKRLQEEGVRGADLVFACIGPALEVYSRYSKVVDAEEREITLGGDPEAREAHQAGLLAYVWEVVGRAALEEVLGAAESKARNGAAGALEEDARSDGSLPLDASGDHPRRRISLHHGRGGRDAEADDDDEDEAPSSKKKKKGLSLPFDVARRFAQPLGIHLDAWEGRCIETEKGVVRLIPVLDRAEATVRPGGGRSRRRSPREDRAGPMQGFLPGMEPRRVAERVPIKGRKEKARPTFRTTRYTSIAARRRSTTFTRRCFCNRPGGPMPAGPDSRPRHSAGRTSSGSPTPFPPSTRKAATRSVSSTPCSWPCRGKDGTDPTISHPQAVPQYSRGNSSLLPIRLSLSVKTGPGKSNFRDVDFLAEAMASSLQAVFDRRGGIVVVRNRTSGQELSAESWSWSVSWEKSTGRLIQRGMPSRCGPRRITDLKSCANSALSACKVARVSGSTGPQDVPLNVEGLKPALEPNALGLPVIGGEAVLPPFFAPGRDAQPIRSSRPNCARCRIRTAGPV